MEERAIFVRTIRKDGWVERGWHFLEPAPPENWRPSCFNFQPGKSEHCFNSEIETWMMDHRECKRCPFRLHGESRHD
jgi:hypothetical protein